ncbi:MAG: solute:Na+ symporter, family, partial [Acetobacteraceae bacterium]|nr:solute:Na+ symporter, family [Acetobacteraceae bacterium]
TLLANNIFRMFRPHTTDASVSRLAKLMVPVIALVSVIFTLNGGTTIVALLLMGYSFVTQLFPSLIASLLPRNPVTWEGAFAGICVGVATVAITSLTHTSVATLFPMLPEALRDLNIGIVALVLNLVALGVVSAVTRRRPAYA